MQAPWKGVNTDVNVWPVLSVNNLSCEECVEPDAMNREHQIDLELNA